MKPPQRLKVNTETIPQELKEKAQWCVWCDLLDDKRGEYTKVPMQARAILQGGNTKAKSNDPKTWATFDEAVKAYNLHPVVNDMPKDMVGLSGIGFFLSRDDNLIGVDLDKVLQDERITDEDALGIVTTLDSYTEISPSGKGLRIFIQGKKPGPRCRKGFLEIYDGSSPRFLTITGQVYSDKPIEEKQKELEDIYNRFLHKPKDDHKQHQRGVSSVSNHTDSELLEKMFSSKKKGAKIKALFQGETSGYASSSEADQALTNHLAWWCDYDFARIDSLFRQSALYRAKWDERRGEETYGEMTITTACNGKVRGEGYQEKKKAKPFTTKTKNEKATTNAVKVEDGRQLGAYVEKDNQLFHRKEQGDDYFDTRLCNFTARIVAEVARDDGAEVTRHLAIEGTLATGKSLPRASVPASQFGSMNWVLEHWGVAATVSAGQSAKDKIREAVQMFSNEDAVSFETIYAHLGWRKINEDYVYLHAGGAIGAGGAVTNISVDAGSVLNLYQLPSPQKPHEALPAIQASFDMLEVAPDTLTFPLWLGLYRAVIDSADFALYLAGLTGVRKSELAALALQHFGAGLDSRHLPGNWSSTANSLEVLAFAAKDALIVLDDFAPQGNQSEQARYHAAADRLFRAQGNSQGRGRLKADGSSRPPKPPRGLILSTGEELPRAHSIRARSLILEVKPDDVRLDVLTQCQVHAASGLYASALTAFIQWLAPKLEQTRENLKRERNSYRAEFISSHGRTTDACAELMVTTSVWCDFARETGFMSEQEIETFKARVFSTLQQIAGNQAQHQRDADPVERFGLLLHAVLTSGRAHMVKTTGENPDNPERYGHKLVGNFYQAQGPKIGWIPNRPEIEGLYLEPEAAYAAVQGLAQQQGETLNMSKTVLYKRLLERGYSIGNQGDRNRFKTTVEGIQQQTIKLSTLYLEKIGIFGIIGINETKSSVNEDFTIPIPENGKTKNGIIGIVDEASSLDYPEKNGIAQKNGIPKTAIKSSLGEENPDYPENPENTDIPPTRFFESTTNIVVADDEAVEI